MFRRTVSIAALVVLVALGGLAIPAQAEEGHGGHESVTVKGEILDMACYVAHEAKGADHAGCAKRCVKGGQPMGLLTAEGKVYLLYASHSDGAAFEQAKEFAGQQVEIQGKPAMMAGIHGLEVNAVKAL